MKITGNIDPDSDLSQKPISRKQANRKSRTPGFSGAGKRGSRPETPLLKWKFDKGKEKDVEFESKKSLEDDRRSGRSLSARKLAAGLWRLQPPESRINAGDELCSVSKSIGFGFQLEPKLHFSNSAMEGATKWDPGSRKASRGLESELKQARTRIHELETDRRSSKKKLKQFLKKLNEERGMWRSREHEKIRAVIDDVKHELNKERKNRKRIEIVNSKLVTKLAELKLSGKRYFMDYEKEKKARELIEEVCDELANEIGEDKAEIEALKRELIKMREEVDDEKKMLQMAEVWREERVQMKLVDAKVTLEDKYYRMNTLVKDLEAFLDLKGVNLDFEEMKRAKMIKRDAGLINIQEIGELSYEPPNPEIAYFNEDDDESGWETVSRVEDEGSSRSESITEISEVGSVRSKRPKKASSISRLWRSRIIDGAVLSPNHGLSAKSGVISPSDWGLEDGEPRGIKGCTVWPHGVVQKNNLKAKLLEARMESQKVQRLRQVLKQKI